MDVVRETRFAAVSPAAATSKASVSAASMMTAAGDSTLRCTRCGDLFPNEAAYAQHWINAHTRIRLSADQQAAAFRPAPTSQPVLVEAADSNGDIVAMEVGDAGAETAPADDDSAHSAAMDTAQAGGAGAVTYNGVAGGAGGPTPAALDPAEDVAALVPSDADFEMSEETLDKMLEEIVPMKTRK